MQRCANCSAENYEGTLFCERCGVALDAISISTKKLGEQDKNFSAGSDMMSSEHVILLHIRGVDDPLALQVHQQVVLGRLSGEEDGTIFISLEPYGASEQGVSRKHAQLTRQGDQLLLRDLGSTNHVFLNGQKLIDMRDYILRDGDEIGLGRLYFRLFFK